MQTRIYLFIILLIFQLNTFVTKSTSNHDSLSLTRRLKDFIVRNLPFSQIFRSISDNLQNGSLDVDEAASKAKDSIVDAIEDQIDTVTEKITSLPEKISEKAEHDWKKIKATPEKVINSVSSAGEKAIDLLLPDAIEKKIKNVKNTIGAEVSDHTSKLLKSFETAQNKVSGEVDLAKQKAKNLFTLEAAHFVTREIDSFTSLPKGTQNKLEHLYHEGRDKNIFEKANAKVERFIGVSKSVKNYVWKGTSLATSFIKEIIVQASIFGVLFIIKVILEVRVVINVPIQVSVSDIASLLMCKKKKITGKGEPNAVKLKKEDFNMKCISIRAEKVSKEVDSFLLKLFLYYEITYFPTLDGEIFLKFITFSAEIAQEDVILKVPAEKFVGESIADECLLSTAVNNTVESVDVRVCVDFKSNSGQYLSVCSTDFKVALLSDD